jgi:hypothetical protein
VWVRLGNSKNLEFGASAHSVSGLFQFDQLIARKNLHFSTLVLKIHRQAWEEEESREMG